MLRAVEHVEQADDGARHLIGMALGPEFLLVAVVDDDAAAAVKGQLLANRDLPAARLQGNFFVEREAHRFEVVLLADGRPGQFVEPVDERGPVIRIRPAARDMALRLALLFVEERPLRIGPRRLLRHEAAAPALDPELLELPEPAAAARQLLLRQLLPVLRLLLGKTAAAAHVHLTIFDDRLHLPAVRRQRAAQDKG